METIDYARLAKDYQRIEQAIAFLERNFARQPSLKEIAASANLSEYHFQRLFTRWVGISPKRFLQFLTKEHAKALLEKSEDVLGVAYASGLSGPGRLHDLFVTCEAVTPGEFKRQGEGLQIAYGFHPTPFGECLLAMTERGICNLSFVQSGGRDHALASLRHRWSKARLSRDGMQTRGVVSQVFAWYTGQTTAPLHLFLSGTNFQIKVWEALLQIPAGAVVTYEGIAACIGRPNAARAVSNAVAQNPIPVIIPCHRVIRKTGEFGGYHYGTARKQALIGWEAARIEQN
jgi:AraC family transcriptional regulator of adaptative response/methylated-DNA-[protein]-cysteine methyltransferase